MIDRLIEFPHNKLMLKKISPWSQNRKTRKHHHPEGKNVRRHVCMYMYGHTYSKRMDQPGKVANPARSQLNRKINISLSAFAPENLVSREGFGSPVPRHQLAHLHSRPESGAYLRESSRFPRRRPFIYLNRLAHLHTRPESGAHLRENFRFPRRRPFIYLNRLAHLHTRPESGAYLRENSRFSRRRPFIYLNRHTPSGQSRVYRVTQLRTDGVHCRESAGTGPINVKVFRKLRSFVKQVRARLPSQAIDLAVRVGGKESDVQIIFLLSHSPRTHSFMRNWEVTTSRLLPTTN